MKRHQKWLAVLTAACMAVPLFALAACGGDKEQNKANVDSDIWAVYTAYAEAAGDDALSYDEWYAQLLATAKGDPGDDGKSAYEIWQEHHPEEETTEAEWLESLKGENGAKGNGWYYGSGAPEAETGSVGDLYLDYATWDVYAKQAAGEGAEWNYLGNLTGKAQRHTIAASGTYEIPIDYEAGVYELTVELDKGEVSAEGLVAKVGDNGMDYYLYNPKDKNYWGALIVKEGDTKVTITNNTSGEIVAGFKLAEYAAPTIELDTQYVLPAIATKGQNDERDSVYFPVAAALADGTKYDIEALPSVESKVPDSLLVNFGGTTQTILSKTFNWKNYAYDTLRLSWSSPENAKFAVFVNYTDSKPNAASMNVLVTLSKPAS